MDRRTYIRNVLTLGFIGTSIFSGCKWLSNYSPPNFETLTSYKELIAELAEAIIPATDTPGAKDAKVEDFIIKMILENEHSRSQSTFLLGLKSIQNYSMKRYGNTFQNCSLEDKISILNHYENKTFENTILRKIEMRILGASFFYIFKRLTIVGFCTSEVGATQALEYDYIPVHYQACIPLLEGQKSWATQ